MYTNTQQIAKKPLIHVRNLNCLSKWNVETDRIRTLKEKVFKHFFLDKAIGFASHKL